MKISKIKSIIAIGIGKWFIRWPIIVIENSNLTYHNLAKPKLIFYMVKVIS